jgi:hypothetical protein
VAGEGPPSTTALTSGGKVADHPLATAGYKRAIARGKTHDSFSLLLGTGQWSSAAQHRQLREFGFQVDDRDH